MIFENFNRKNFKICYNFDQKGVTECEISCGWIDRNLLKNFLDHFCNQRNWSEQERLGLRNIDDIYRCNCNPQISYLLSEKVFFVLGFVLEGINNENFMVSCFSSIYKTAWTSVTTVTKQNRCFIRHSPSSCSAVLISVTQQVKAFAF